jgi:ATP-binding cassette subfamily F protein 3
MQKLEAERSALHTVMSQTQAVKELADQGKQLKQIDEQMPALEARWLELTDLLENAAV